MGLYKDKADLLGKTFSFYEFCEVAHLNEFQFKEGRNILKSWAKRGFIKRLSRNNYEKIE